VPVALCACLPDELHHLGVLAVAYQLARVGFRPTYLGAGLPFEDLERACQRLRPAVVCLSVAREAVFLTHKPRLLEVVGRHGGASRFLLGGQGVAPADRDIEAAGATVWPADRPLSLLARPK
jgi:methanogenic corrinoid protein MtbC1